MMFTTPAEAHRKRTMLRLLAVGIAALCLPAFLSRGRDDNADAAGATLLSEEQEDAQIMRLLMENLNEEAYGELNMPELLNVPHARMVQPNYLEAAMADIAASFGSDFNNLSLTPYSITDAVEATSVYKNTVALLVYDPEADGFEFITNTAKHLTMNGHMAKLRTSFEFLASMLRRAFPERFQGAKSPELVIAIGSADCPHLHRDCLATFPHTNPRCEQQDAPVMQLGSAFRHTQILPNMIAMPMPVPAHQACFLKFALRPNIPCTFLPHEVYEQTSFEDLIPQVVWRGSDYGYLEQYGDLSMGNITRDIEDRIDPTDEEMDKKVAGTQAMEESYDNLRPRWKAVVLTAQADREAEEKGDGTLPWANMKFSSAGNLHTREEYEKWPEYGIPAMDHYWLKQQLAEYKYQIDLGGGGGTTWNGCMDKLAMPGLLFHHVTPTKDYIHDHMKPWIHYVPVAPDLKDLKEKYEWAESHPKAAKMIADQGTELMRYLKSTEGFGMMYQKSFIEPTQSVLGAYQPVATTHPGLSWREVLKQLKGEAFRTVVRCGKMCETVSVDLDGKQACIYGRDKADLLCKKLRVIPN